MSGDRSTGPEIENRELDSSVQCRALEPPPRIDPRDATRGGVNGPALPVQRGRERPLSINTWLFGPLFGGFLAALVLLGVSHAAAFAVWAMASAATVGIGVWHARQSGRPVLPSAVMLSRRRGER